MIRTFSAFTTEIDAVEKAVTQICSQLPPADQLLPHTIGLVSCVPEFVETGVVKALQETLPFALIGQTTIAAASPGSSSLEILNVLVITSDELEFVLGQTKPITEENAELISESYRAAIGDRAEKPAFVLVYAPLLHTVGGDFFVDVFDELTDHTPVFGSLAVDNTIDYRKSRVIYQGEATPDRIAFLAVYGDVRPRFYQATISGDSIFEEKGVVTSSDGNQLKTVDGKPAVEFLKSKGLVTDANGVIEGVNSFPYIVDFNDGTPPVIRVIFATTPEGYAVCLGDIPEGSTLSVGFFNEDEILATTRARLASFSTNEDQHAGIIFSCVGRYFTMVLDPAGEVDAVHEFVDPFGKPYLFAYSGGEICPVTNIVDGASLTNRFHNATFVALVF
ncbi:MAG: FIST C-terminal domain-containing protein [Coriobacteriales bacterium]|nr:FIST C-terminal domain-containing protein [Coriobacteriales bacterium]